MRTVVSMKTALFALLLLIMAPVAHSEGLTDFQGNPQTIEDQAGKDKWTVIMFWASDCQVCNSEAHTYVAFQKKHQDGNIRMLGISLDGKEKREAAEHFIKEHQLNFPNLIGEPETIGGIYYDMTGSFFVGTPTFIILSPDGKVRAADVGAIPPKIIEDFITEQTQANKK